MSRQRTIGMVYAGAALAALIWWMVGDSGIAILLFALALAAGLLHLLLLQQHGDTHDDEDHHRAENTARRGNMPPERPTSL